jgi:hypothetical protein
MWEGLPAATSGRNSSLTGCSAAVTMTAGDVVMNLYPQIDALLQRIVRLQRLSFVDSLKTAVLMAMLFLALPPHLTAVPEVVRPFGDSTKFTPADSIDDRLLTALQTGNLAHEPVEEEGALPDL